jgi:signal transduction histidine kinase
MDNAINYAGQGTEIEVSAEQLSGFWHFTFKDNGTGIPAQHQPRIFERFYRIDKGRSREMGGTGLGLAIVKNAVLMHGGTISVSTPDTGGLAFDFTVRK